MQNEAVYFAGGLEVSHESLVTIHKKEFRAEFPGVVGVRCFGNQKWVAKVGDTVRPVTRMIVFTATEKPHKCGYKCREAKGNQCECECKGRNHGAGAMND